MTTWEAFDGINLIALGDFPMAGVDKTNAVAHGGKDLLLYTDGNTFANAGLRYEPATKAWTTLPHRLGFGWRTEVCGGVVQDRLYFVGGLEDLRMTARVDVLTLPTD